MWQSLIGVILPSMRGAARIRSDFVTLLLKFQHMVHPAHVLQALTGVVMEVMEVEEVATAEALPQAAVHREEAVVEATAEAVTVAEGTAVATATPKFASPAILDAG